MKIFETIKSWWTGHGTKLLGGLIVLVGALQEVLPLIQGVDPKHAGLWALVITLGGAVVKRGFANTKALNQVALDNETEQGVA